MGRAGNSEIAVMMVEDDLLDLDEILKSRRQPGTQAVAREVDYDQFSQSILRVTRVPLDMSFRRAMKEINAYVKSMLDVGRDPVLSVDFETAAKYSSWDMAECSLRTVQIGWGAETDIGIEQRQFVIDCWPIDSTSLTKIFRSKKVKKVIHNIDFEQKWAISRYGCAFENIYDTRIAWEVIQKHLAKMTDGQRARLGYGKLEAKPKARTAVFFDNKLATLVERELGVKIPKEEQTSDWGLRNLRGSQWAYAAMDVAVLPLLYERTIEIVEKLGLQEEVEAAIKSTDEGIRRKTEEKLPDMRDDTDMIIDTLRSARSAEEVENIFDLARMLPVNHRNQARLQEAFDERLLELLSVDELLARL
jgi:ribonuclease D